MAAASIGLSLAVHAALIAAIASGPSAGRRAVRLTDSPPPAEAATTLTIPVPPAPADSPASPEPAPPEPEPSPAPAPVKEPPAEQTAEPTPPLAADAIALPGPARSEPPPPAPPIPAEAPRAAASAPPAPSPAPAPMPVVGASFAGVDAPRAVSVVYAVDASGPMATCLPFVLRELESSVNRLTPDQQFQVVIFRVPPPDAPPDARAIEFFRGTRGARLAPATAQNKLALASFLSSVEPTGRSAPLAGLQAALSLKPEVVFLLSRPIRRTMPGLSDAAESIGGAEHDAVLSALDRLNPRDPRTGLRRAIIKTIQFIDPEPGLLARISDEHGDGPGAHRVIPLGQLERR